MGYVVDRVVISDAYLEPKEHYRLLPGGRSKRVDGRRPSMRFLASAKETKGGISGVLGKQATLLEDALPGAEQLNDFVNDMRDRVRTWREGGYAGTAQVTRRLLEWWFERDEERTAMHQRFFFAQREAIETLIFLYEVQSRRKMPETGDLIRYALKLATGTGKTIVMAQIVVWATLHKQKVSGSSLSGNFLVLVPNLTVRDRVSGVPRGDGLNPGGSENLYRAFDMVPPEYAQEFQPDILVRNWQSIPLEGKRDDWIADDLIEEGRFIPASVLMAMQKRRRLADPNAQMRRFLNGWRDVLVINDEAHHVYGEKRARRGEEPDFIKWSHIIDRVSKACRLSLVVDLSATPWYGTGSPKPDGTLFEWLVSDFSVYDAFESGLVKVVRLPDETHAYTDLWRLVSGAKTKEEYISACRGAIAAIYSSWKDDYDEWRGMFDFARRGPAPVMLLVANDAARASWLFEHITQDYELLRNPDDDDRSKWVTLQVDSKVFDADKGNEAVLREMVNTVGKPGAAGESVRCIVSVNMLSEGWDVKSITHILGLRAFGSPLLTEQIIGRGLRRSSYDILNQPLDEREEGSEETVDAFGIPFIGFPVEKRKRPKAGDWSHKPVWIEKDDKKSRFRISVPNVRAWAVAASEPLSKVVDVAGLPEMFVDPKVTPPEVSVHPVVGGRPEAILTLDRFRDENPLLGTAFRTARELLDRTSPGEDYLGFGPTFDELLELVMSYLETKVRADASNDIRDVGIYYWRQRMVDTLDTAIRSGGVGSVRGLPILGDPEHLDSEFLRRFQWTGIVGDGKKCHSNRVPCHTELEHKFADFLDGATDVVSYFKNERFGFSVTYYENNRPRQYFPDFLIRSKDATGSEAWWVAETKGEERPNTALKQQAAEIWCQRMSTTQYGQWGYLFLQQRKLEPAIANRVSTLRELLALMAR